MYAIFVEGGKQHFAEPGKRILIELREEPKGSQLTFEEILAVGGEKAVIGQPTVAGAKVIADIVNHVRMKKVQIQDYKRRKNYRRHRGHRQPMTEIVVKEIVVG